MGLECICSQSKEVSLGYNWLGVFIGSTECLSTLRVFRVLSVIDHCTGCAVLIACRVSPLQKVALARRGHFDCGGSKVAVAVVVVVVLLLLLLLYFLLLLL